jgi:hypothetical protein
MTPSSTRRNNAYIFFVIENRGYPFAESGIRNREKKRSRQGEKLDSLLYTEK